MAHPTETALSNEINDFEWLPHENGAIKFQSVRTALANDVESYPNQESPPLSAYGEYDGYDPEPFPESEKVAPVGAGDDLIDIEATNFTQTLTSSDPLDAIIYDAALLGGSQENDALVFITQSQDDYRECVDHDIPAIWLDGCWENAHCEAVEAWDVALLSNDDEWRNNTLRAFDGHRGSLKCVAAVVGFSPRQWMNAAESDDNEPINIHDLKAEARGRLLPEPLDLSGDVSAIPRTDFIYGKHYIRNEASITVAAAGTGKSFLTFTEALAMATGRDLLGTYVGKPKRIWYWTEDRVERATLRLRAAMELHGIEAKAVGDRIRVSSFRDKRLKLATLQGGSVKVAHDLVTELAETARDENIDVIVFDTLKKIHGLNENSNPEMDALFDELIKIAEIGNCAVETVHHTGKPGDKPQDMSSLRGASAIIGAARAGRLLCRMTKDEGEKAGVDNHKAFFSVEGGKFNLSPEDAHKSWFELSGRDMANGENVGQLQTWQWPDPFDCLTDAVITATLNELRGKPMRKDPQASEWAGHVLARHLDLDMDDKANKSKVKSILTTWDKNGVLKVEQRDDGKRNKRPHYVTTGKRPS